MQAAPPFALQRTIMVAMTLVPPALAAAIAVMHSDPTMFQPPQPESGTSGAAQPLDFGLVHAVSAIAAAIFVVLALVTWRVYRRRADRLAGEPRRTAQCRARLAPHLLLTLGAIFGLSDWLLSREARPGLVLALVVLAGMIARLPRHDPDAAR